MRHKTQKQTHIATQPSYAPYYASQHQPAAALCLSQQSAIATRAAAWTPSLAAAAGQPDSPGWQYEEITKLLLHALHPQGSRTNTQATAPLLSDTAALSNQFKHHWLESSSDILDNSD